MKLQKQEEIPFKTDKQIETEIKEILSGTGKHKHGGKLRKAAKVLSAFKTQEEIQELFIAEYKKKYKPLQEGKTTLKDIKKESLEAVKKSKQ